MQYADTGRLSLIAGSIKRLVVVRRRCFLDRADVTAAQLIFRCRLLGALSHDLFLTRCLISVFDEGRMGISHSALHGCTLATIAGRPISSIAPGTAIHNKP